MNELSKHVDELSKQGLLDVITDTPSGCGRFANRYACAGSIWRGDDGTQQVIARVSFYSDTRWALINLVGDRAGIATRSVTCDAGFGDMFLRYGSPPRDADMTEHSQGLANYIDCILPAGATYLGHVAECLAVMKKNNPGRSMAAVPPGVKRSVFRAFFLRHGNIIKIRTCGVGAAMLSQVYPDCHRFISLHNGMPTGTTPWEAKKFLEHAEEFVPDPHMTRLFAGEWHDRGQAVEHGFTCFPPPGKSGPRRLNTYDLVAALAGMTGFNNAENLIRGDPFDGRLAAKSLWENGKPPLDACDNLVYDDHHKLVYDNHHNLVTSKDFRDWIGTKVGYVSDRILMTAPKV